MAKIREARGRRPKRDLRFRDLIEPALEAKQFQGNRPSSIETDRKRLGKILPYIGHMKTSTLGRPTAAGKIERILQDLARGNGRGPLKGSTINRFHSLLSSVFTHARRQGLLKVNPLADGSLPWSKESQIHVRYLGRDEQRRLLRVIREDDPKKTIEVELAILTGLRRGEQFNAKWEDWKVKEGILYVAGKSGLRPVRISRAAGRCLRAMRKRAPRDQAFITPERNEGPSDRRLWFERAVKKAGLSPAFRYHDLRHTFCSRLAQAGVSLLKIKELAGHKAYQTTLRYSHLASEGQRRAVEKVEF